MNGPAEAGRGMAKGGRGRVRRGLRRELLIVLPASLLLLVVISTFTLLSYRTALGRLRDDRQAEAAEMARAVAARLAEPGGAGSPAAIDGGSLRRLAPGARGVAVLEVSGATLAAAGELPPVAIPPSLAGGRLRGPVAVGPDAALPGAVAGFAPLGGGRGMVRVDLPAVALAGQLEAIRLLTWLVLSVNGAVLLLALFFLSQLLTPYENLLARARQVGGAGAESQDETEFLLATLERALETLARQAQSSPQADADPGSLEADLAALEKVLSTSLESGLLLLGGGGEVLALNPLGANLLGVTQPPAGTPLAELLSAQTELLAILAAAVAAGQPVKRQECAVQSAAGTLTVGLTVHPLRRDGRLEGAARGYLVLFADLTESRRRAQESRLADSLASLGEMAAGVAHELRNSLATMRGYLTLIERRPDEDSIGEDLAEIRREADHLQRVLEDFLSFARPGTARPQEFSLSALVRRAAADPALAGMAVEVRGTAPADRAVSPASGGAPPALAAPAAAGSPASEPRLRGDPQLIERALRNLLHNAVQAERDAGNPGPIAIAIGHQPDGVEVTIEDRGPGIPPELRERLFHPFATGRPHGVGLGLALAHRIVTLHGGRLQLEDRPGGGTSARILFPRDMFVTEGNATARGESLHLASDA
ncbi:MAG TPA: ATP-binding protein [Thermoanaerobaculia bacterium]|nr:ATP-binding protein [Thermoanaerobaculia bacterium]